MRMKATHRSVLLTSPRESLIYLTIFNQPEVVYRIISGDPSKGTMAVEQDASLAKGMRVQVCCIIYVGYQNCNSMMDK